MKIGLALSGGVARGAAHIGVLKCLEERGVKLAYISGTSAGSLVASLYCAGLPLERIEKIARSLQWKDMLRLTVPRMGLVNSSHLLNFMQHTIGNPAFEDLRIPLAVTAVDLIKGEEVVIQEGPVAKAVQASCAIPGIFTPVKLGDKLLVDGGLVCNLPSRILREKKMDLVIAVNLNADRFLSREPLNVMEVLLQSYDVVQKLLDRSSHQYADLLIQPSLGDISAWDISQAAECIRRGYAASTRVLDTCYPLRQEKKKHFLMRWLKL